MVSNNNSLIKKNNSISLKSNKQHFNQINFSSTSLSNKILNNVKNLNKFNLKCCDCNDINNLEWISTNLLCILCIKCSGVHRSLGSHISKIRSLTLDNFENNIELLYLIENFVSNEIVNSIYESKLKSKDKITPRATDDQRLKFITNKYKLKKYVRDKETDIDLSLTQLIKAIQLNSIHLIQRSLAQTTISLKNLSIKYNDLHNNKNNNETLFQLTLKHNDFINSKHIYYITEFLLNNDMIIDHRRDNFNLFKDNKLIKSAYDYWEIKLNSIGSYQAEFDNKTTSKIKSMSALPSLPPISTLAHSSRSSSKSSSSSSLSHSRTRHQPGKSNESPSTHSDPINNTNTESLNPVSRKVSVKNRKRWSLSSIPVSPQQLITMHKSFKSVKDKK